MPVMWPDTSPANVRSCVQLALTAVADGLTFGAALLLWPQACTRTIRATMPAPRSMCSDTTRGGIGRGGAADQGDARARGRLPHRRRRRHRNLVDTARRLLRGHGRR